MKITNLELQNSPPERNDNENIFEM